MITDLATEWDNLRIACPDFLFTASPAFPWPPRLQSGDVPSKGTVDDGTALMDVDLPAPPKSALGAACKAVHDELAQHPQRATQSFTSDFAAHLDAIMDHAVAHPEECAAIMGSSGLCDLREDVVHAIVSQTVAPACSFGRCCMAAQWILLPALQRLQAPPTTGLLAAIAHFGECRRNLIVEAYCTLLIIMPFIMLEQQPFFASLMQEMPTPRRSCSTVLLSCCPEEQQKALS